MKESTEWKLRGRGVMTHQLSELFEKARRARMSKDQQEEQRRSFAYGNSKIENDRITRDTIDREAESLKAEDGSER